MRARPLRAPPRPLGRRGDEDGDALVVARAPVAERARPLVREPHVSAAREEQRACPASGVNSVKTAHAHEPDNGDTLRGPKGS